MLQRLIKNGLFPLVLLALSFSMTRPADAYVDLAPTLAKVIGDSQRIAVIEVTDFNPTERLLTLRETRVLKGEPSRELLRHRLSSTEGATAPRPVLQWAVPGARGVCFSGRRGALVCVGLGWYQVRAAGDAWTLSKERPDLPLAYFGSVSRLIVGIEHMLAGEEAVLTVVAHGAAEEGASFDLALNRTSLPDLVRVQRIRADLKMPPMVMAASANPAYMLGEGAVDPAEVPELIDGLSAEDPLVRTDAAEDLRRLGPKAGAARDALTPLLADSAAPVRCAAAAALLQIDPKNTEPLTTLSQGLADGDAVERRAAAQAVGRAGSAASDLALTLAGLLQDADESVRLVTLQAIAMLGPAAATAVPAVTPLLDDSDLAIDAADALGRIGPAARPVPEALVRMLSCEQEARQWAAVRAMAQIGGPEAKPAVEFIMRALPEATEVEGYNMMIYLALMGPVAQEASDVLRSTHIKNPVLPSATLWAISAETTLPWQQQGGRFRGGPPMGPGGGGGADIGTLIYRAYVRELGERLRPTARLLAEKLMDGSAGDVPAWGYEILTCAGDESVQTFVSHLDDDRMDMRERATVALGYMGPSAAAARKPVAAALTRVSSEKEKRLLAWCLREMGRRQWVVGDRLGLGPDS